MKNIEVTKKLSTGIASLAMALTLIFIPFLLSAQRNMIINMAPIDGVPITPENILGYQVQSFSSCGATVHGTIRYRGSSQSLQYSFHCSIREGINTFSLDQAHPQWTFSSSAFQELFLTYRFLPEGVFEYCVTISPDGISKENTMNVFDECLYHKANDLFLINLVDPADKEKLKEYNPLLAWIANYSFSTQLNYTLKVTEIKQGQTPVSALMRNQPVFEEHDLLQNSIVYPVYAKPLQANQPYAWGVSAYYKGVLLGGSETWQFIIPDDTAKPANPTMRSYIDIKKEKGTERLNVIGQLKLKYILDKYRKDVLQLRLQNEEQQNVNIKPSALNAIYGDNRYILNLKDSCSLKHLKEYTLIISSQSTGETYTLPFKYQNPDLIK